MAEDRHLLVRMNQCIGHVQQFAKRGRSEFVGNLMLQHAVLWNIQLVSVAARHLSDEAREMHPDVDWKRVERLCHDVIGDPWDVRAERVWECINGELPALKHQIREIILERQVK
ncbi:MAG: DUF86 domain-containing protein [Planctomycetota bacterium]